MTRALLALAALPMCLGGCDDSPEIVDAEEPLSVMLVVVDTLRADALGERLMPELDAYADRSLRFERAYSTAPWTKPSVASILTGLDPRAHGVTLHPHALHSSHRTLAEVFAEAGYATHGVQSNLLLSWAHGFDQGFVRYESEIGGTLARHDHSTGAEVNAAALAWLDVRDESVPFFLYVHHYEPHHQYLRLDEDLLPEGFVLEEPLLATEAATMDAMLASLDQLTSNGLTYVRARYDSEVRYQDRLLRELLDGLEERGLAGSTLVAVTADHGEEFMEHGSLSHIDDKLFDELVRVPMILAGPGVSRGVRGQPVSLRDLGRTLLDLAGLEEEAFPGTSWFDDGGAAVAHGRRAPNANEDSKRLAIVGEVEGVAYKLVLDVGTGERALFDLAADPAEQANVVDSRSDVAEALEARLAAFEVDAGVDRVDVPEPLPEDPAVDARRLRFWEEHEDELRKLGYLED